ncbi:MAG: molybdopterin molybdenumtransferase MoeA, partial [Pseudomonadota bacterium]
RVFLVPLIHAMLGLSDIESAPQVLPLSGPIEANGPRTHYMRAVTEHHGGALRVRPVNSQDSSLLTRLAQADALIVRSPNAPAAALGEAVSVLPLDF